MKSILEYLVNNHIHNDKETYVYTTIDGFKDDDYYVFEDEDPHAKDYYLIPEMAGKFKKKHSDESVESYFNLGFCPNSGKRGISVNAICGTYDCKLRYATSTEIEKLKFFENKIQEYIVSEYDKKVATYDVKTNEIHFEK